MVGSGERWVVEVDICPAKGKFRLPTGVIRNDVPAPYVPKSIKDPFCHAGNSVCFTIQLAHLMGCNPIYLLGFTLQSGTPYFFGRTNPVLRRTSVYDAEVPMAWLKWYESKFPGRVKLAPGYGGPIYDVFEVDDALGRYPDEEDSEASQGNEPDQEGGDVSKEERPGPDGGASTPWPEI
jgi:hypothetical protein